MSCVYTYENRTFDTKKELDDYLASQKETVKAFFMDYQDRMSAKGELPTLEGFQQYYKKFEGLPKFQSSSKLFTVQSGNLQAIKDGKKTLSFRTVKDADFINEGDNLDIVSDGQDANLRVQVDNKYLIKKFPEISQKRKDDMARMLGSYKDFNDMLKVNDYLNPSSRASKKFPQFSKFLRGEEPGVFIEYSTVERDVDTIIEEALNRNPAFDPYQNLLDEVITEIGKQIELLERTDMKNKTFKENRLKRLQDTYDKAVKTKDLLSFVAETLEDLMVNESAIDKLIEKEDTTDQELISKLASFYRLVKSYSFLDNIEEEINIVIDGSTDESIDASAAFKQLQKAISIKKNIESKYLSAMEKPAANVIKKFAANKSYDELKKEAAEAIAIQNKKIKNAKANKSISDKTRNKRIKSAQKVIDRKERTLARAAHDVDSVIALMGSVEKDIDFFEKWLGAPEQSSDPIIAMFSLSVKYEMENSRRETIDDINDIQLIYDEFKRDGNASMSLKKMYGDLIETTYDSKTQGERVAFVDKFDKKKFNKARKAYIASMDLDQERAKLIKEQRQIKDRANLKKSKKGDSSRSKRIAYLLEDGFNKRLIDHLSYQWYSKNTQALSDLEIRAILKQKMADLDSLAMVQEWAEENMNLQAMVELGILPEPTQAQLTRLNYETEPVYKGELRRLSDEYINKKWTNLYNLDGTPKNSKGKLHKVLVEKYKESQKQLPLHRRQGLVVPGIYKATTDRVIEKQGLLSTVKNSWKELKERYTGDNLAEDTEYGESDSFGNSIANIPTYFYNTLEASDTSIDVVQSVVQYIRMADVYSARTKSLDTALFFMEKLKTRKTGKQNSHGTNFYDNAARRFGIKRQLLKDDNENNSEERMRKFVEMVIFGQSNKQWKIGNVRMDKVIQGIMQYASFTSFALPIDAGSKLLMGATANFNQQLAQQWIEASARDSGLTLKTLLKGQQLFATHGKDILINDFGKSGNKSLVGQLIDRYDVIQGEYLDTLGNKMSGTKMRQLFNMDTLYFHRHLSEYEPQVSMFLGVMNDTKVKQNGKEISLMEAYELGPDNKIKLKEGVKWSKDEEFMLMTRLHGVNKTFNGVYNSFSKSALEQHVLGKIIMFFRKYLYPSLRRRWSGERIDYEQDKFVRGYALSFWRSMYRDLFIHRENAMEVLKGEHFTAMEKKEAVKSLVSFSIGFANMVLAYAIRQIMEATDDEDELVLNYMLYNAVRMQSETWSFWNPAEFMRILRSPTILTTYVDRVTKFATQAMFDPMGEYKRASGSNEKGDSKLYARFVKMMVGQTSYSTNPEYAVKNFENLIN